MRTLLVLLAAASFVGAGDGVSKDKLADHVKVLASPEYLGRRGPGARKAESYVARAFLAAGLKTTVQQAPGRDGVAVRNVIGVLQVGEQPSKEHIIVSAHYDHLGRWGGVLFPGASDNAAGVAAMLEIARLLKAPLSRDVIFIGFDQEELGLIGSTRYAKKPLRPLAECAAFLTFDILGRDLYDATTGILFCTGTERSDTLFELVKGAPKPEGLAIMFSGADMVGRRSDFAPFMDRKVPFLFFSTGEHRNYHQPTDVPAKLDYDKLHREATVLLEITRRVANAPRAKFLNEPAARMEEVTSLRIVLEQLLAHPEKLNLTKGQIFLGTGLLSLLKGIEKNGTFSPQQRTSIVAMGRQLTSQRR